MTERNVKVTLTADTSQYVAAMTAARRATGWWFESWTRRILVGFLYGTAIGLGVLMVLAFGMAIWTAH